VNDQLLLQEEALGNNSSATTGSNQLSQGQVYTSVYASKKWQAIKKGCIAATL
jgi:hypothetical protein